MTADRPPTVGILDVDVDTERLFIRQRQNNNCWNRPMSHTQDDEAQDGNHADGDEKEPAEAGHDALQLRGKKPPLGIERRVTHLYCNTT